MGVLLKHPRTEFGCSVCKENLASTGDRFSWTDPAMLTLENNFSDDRVQLKEEGVKTT